MRNINYNITLLDLTYVHEVDWTASITDFDWVYRVTQAGFDYSKGEVIEVATLRVNRKDDLRYVFSSLRKHGIDMVYFMGVNPGYPKYVKVIVKGSIDLSTRFLAQELGLLEVYAYYVNGIEHWGFLALNRESLDQFLKEITNYGKILSNNIRVLKIEDLITANASRLDVFLNSSEYKVLRHAFERGFFNIPRSISMDELSKELGLSKSTIDRYLRSSLNKILRIIVRNEN
ncbi:helix-turn-helix domain-containing protein [Vulcanisaeta distributa]|uniref:Bacterio-opsin activator HTH domain protein n=1 Tax=Vulcanisaeta distributa (strain DSM 14429 / JCM 11212 / NBRC 100878 / IC-017) TaxID=572478 RepID=E1QSY1_VULDI|nr:helix-turn-helix domain-containing protein [Vulcanisaeta distributa]ADN50848.1 Bacterio-opsin activator HTH domain protein [Vulcanisaeta distributa DSM 14429]